MNEGELRTFITSSGEFHGRVSQSRHPVFLDGPAKWLLGGLGGGLGAVMVWGGSCLLRSRRGRESDGY